MADPASLREQARKCRELALETDDRTAANLRMLADEYDEEALLSESGPKPRPAD